MKMLLAAVLVALIADGTVSNAAAISSSSSSRGYSSSSSSTSSQWYSSSSSSSPSSYSSSSSLSSSSSSSLCSDITYCWGALDEASGSVNLSGCASSEPTLGGESPNYYKCKDKNGTVQKVEKSGNCDTCSKKCACQLCCADRVKAEGGNARDQENCEATCK